MADGDALGYDALVIATGAPPRRLAGLEHGRDVHYLRSVGDSRRLRGALLALPRVAVVGGGFIGLEVAAAARTLGCEVTVVEAAPAPLAPIIGPELGRIVQRWHEEHGVEFRCGAAVRSARGDALALEDGSSVAAGLAVVGVGAEPCVEWLEPAGLTMHRGVVCDRDGRTSAAGVYAVGDAACRHEDGVCVAGEHWTARRPAGAARREGDSSGAPIPGRRATRATSGPTSTAHASSSPARPALPARITIESGSVEARSFVAFCRAGEAVTGVFAMNSPGPFVRARPRPGRRGAPGGGAWLRGRAEARLARLGACCDAYGWLARLGARSQFGALEGRLGGVVRERGAAGWAGSCPVCERDPAQPRAWAF